MKSGYVPCACRDCFETAISSDGEPTFCSECIDAGCARECDLDHDTYATHSRGECQRNDAYEGDL